MTIADILKLERDKQTLDKLEKRFKQSGNWGLFRGEAGVLADFRDSVPHNYSNGDYLRGVLNGNRFEAFIGIWQDHEGVLVRDRDFRRELASGHLYESDSNSDLIEQLLEKGECEFCYRVNPSWDIGKNRRDKLTPQLAVSSKRLADMAIEQTIIDYLVTVSMQIGISEQIEVAERCNGSGLNDCCFDCIAKGICKIDKRCGTHCDYFNDSRCPLSAGYTLPKIERIEVA